jgi:hypothetical protein
MTEYSVKWVEEQQAKIDRLEHRVDKLVALVADRDGEIERLDLKYSNLCKALYET